MLRPGWPMKGAPSAQDSGSGSGSGSSIGSSGGGGSGAKGEKSAKPLRCVCVLVRRS